MIDTKENSKMAKRMVLGGMSITMGHYTKEIGRMIRWMGRVIFSMKKVTNIKDSLVKDNSKERVIISSSLGTTMKEILWMASLMAKVSIFFSLGKSSKVSSRTISFMGSVK